MMLCHFCTMVSATLMVVSPIVGAASSYENARVHHQRMLNENGNKTYIDVGNIRPEGIHALTAIDVVELGLDADAGSSYVLVSEFFYGGVKLVNVVTQEITQLVASASYKERGGLGVFYAGGHIITASAGPLVDNPFEVYVFNPSTGDLVTTCVPNATDDGFEPGFFNDIEVVGDTAYVTDSTINRLWSFNIPGAVDGNCELTYQELDEAVFLGTDDAPVRSNGE